MDVVIDANILFAALIKDGMTANLIFFDRLHLYAPEYLLAEFSKYRREILAKTHRPSDRFDTVLAELSTRIHFVPRDEFDSMIQAAEKISPDTDDSIYFALALSLSIPIWSNDRRLKKQKTVKVYTTSDLMSLFSSDLKR